MKQNEKILIIDFGSQFTQLITRRVREANVYSEIHSHKITFDEIKSISSAVSSVCIGSEIISFAISSDTG